MLSYRVSGTPHRRRRRDNLFRSPWIVDIEVFYRAILAGRCQMRFLAMAPIDAMDARQMCRDVLYRARAFPQVPNTQISIVRRCQQIARYTIEANLRSTSWQDTHAKTQHNPSDRNAT